jgi:starch synthase
MHLFFITAELEPLNDESGIGHYVAQLGGSLSALGHRVTAVVPLQTPGIVDRFSFARRLSPLVVTLPQGDVSLYVFDSRLPNGIELRLLSHPELFENRPSCTDAPDEPLRHAVLARAALQLAADEAAQNGPLHIIQSFGLPGALAPVYASTMPQLQGTKTVLCLDSVENQGRCHKDWVEKLGLSWDDFTAERFEFYGDLNTLKAGLVTADLLIFPGIERGRQLSESAAGLEGVIRSRGKSVAGLLPGLDYARWNPATDAHLPVRFDAEQHTGKRSCKAHLQNQLGLPVRPDVPLIAIAPPFDGLGEPFAAILNRALRSEVQVVAPRGLQPSLSAAIEKSLDRWPRSFARPELDEAGWHQLLGGADILLLDAPSGWGAELLLSALRYGALPVVRHAGLAREIVVDLSGTLESGNGFVVHEQGEELPLELLAVLRRACATLRYGEPFEAALCRAMSLHCSWEHRAKSAEMLYAELLPTRKIGDDAETEEKL